MNVAAKYLQEIRVADVMTRDVLTVSEHATMPEASQLLTTAGVTGAPVVNEFGHCVGVISNYDFMRRDRPRGGSCGNGVMAEESLLTSEDLNQRYWTEFGAEDLVESYMSRAPQTISAKLSLLDAAEYMLGSHIHRLVVVDVSSRPAGVISTFDVLKAVVAHSSCDL
ncbi:CBS domain-containing protein [Adhaeretor mobilis]|uniref:Inosine 5'-monophosphate dehydrogenase n=1 Tax=Adhaeretor mobilis TaxID=1930276 RepID=A0A517MZC9_9BACT|nr:CBS domain-containing protein [Adhaeretor mobilis]QDT00246.1 inosine 5'-monophosphate dehydrogenase [Adhaeretor mobilis]